MDPKQFQSFSARLNEHRNLCALQGAGGLAINATALGFDALAKAPLRGAGRYGNMAEVARALRLRAAEPARRPVQFTRDAPAGRYGERIRAEVEEGIQYPDNQYPWQKPPAPSALEMMRGR